MSVKIKTYGDLLENLENLTTEQLEQFIRFSDEEHGSIIDEIWILEEDHINPTGEGVEPVSAYEGEEDDFDITEETIYPKGLVILCGTSHISMEQGEEHD